MKLLRKQIGNRNDNGMSMSDHYERSYSGILKTAISLRIIQGSLQKKTENFLSNIA